MRDAGRGQVTVGLALAAAVGFAALAGCTTSKSSGGGKQPGGGFTTTPIPTTTAGSGATSTATPGTGATATATPGGAGAFFVQAILYEFNSSGATPVSAALVFVGDNSPTPSPIANATVVLNGASVPYTGASYVLNPWTAWAAGSTATLSIDTPYGSTAGVVVLPYAPALLQPSPMATWSVSVSNTGIWTLGGSQNAVWFHVSAPGPTATALPYWDFAGTATSYTVPANTLNLAGSPTPVLSVAFVGAVNWMRLPNTSAPDPPPGYTGTPPNFVAESYYMSWLYLVN